MTTTDVEMGVIAVLARHLEADAATITTDARLEEDLSLDSLDSGELLIALEEQFHIRFSLEWTERLIEVDTVRDLVAVITGRLAEAPPHPA